MSPIQILAITALIVSVIGVCLYDYIERKITIKAIITAKCKEIEAVKIDKQKNKGCDKMPTIKATLFQKINWNVKRIFKKSRKTINTMECI